MPVLCDTNVLLALSYDQHIHHLAALDWLGKQGQGDVVLCRVTQLSLLRLLCNSSVMEKDVCTMSEAWKFYDAILADYRFQFSPESADLERFLRQFTASQKTSSKLWQDAYLAAFALASGLQMVTFDSGFKQFSGLNALILKG